MRRHRLALAATLIALAGFAGSSRTAVATPRDVAVVTVSSASGGRIIPAGFLGLSLENSAIIPYAGEDPKAPDPVFLQLVRNLNPGQFPQLRIGGDSTDWAWYPVPGMSKPRGVRVTLTPRWLGVMHAIAADLDARLIMGVDLEADSHAVADGEANAFERGIGKRYIEALELGNEPNLYGSFTWYVLPGGVHVMGRPPGYDYSSFLGDFSSFAKGLPGPLAGPTTGAATWIPDTGQFLAAEPRVGVVTLHRYPVQTCFVPPSAPTYPTAANLLAPAATTGLADGIAAYATLAHARHLPLRIDEMNTDSCGAAPGVANAFVSALWALDALFEMARVGVDGVNVHTYPGATYQLFTFAHERGKWRASVSPEYYGLEMFAQAAPAGSRLVSTTITNAQRIVAWATRGRDGYKRVVLINKSLDRRTVAVGPANAAGLGPATLEPLRAPRLSSNSQVTLGGQSFGAETTTGRLAGRSLVSKLELSQGRYELTLPAESAALVTLP